MLTLYFSSGTAMTKENAGAMERFSIDARAQNPGRDNVFDTKPDGGKPNGYADSAGPSDGVSRELISCLFNGELAAPKRVAFLIAASEYWAWDTWWESHSAGLQLGWRLRGKWRNRNGAFPHLV
jgi:hypothetical protein